MEGEGYTVQTSTKLGYYSLGSLQRNACGRKSIPILYILLFFSFILWIIFLSVMQSHYSKMSSEMEKRQSELTALKSKYSQMSLVISGLQVNYTAQLGNALQEVKEVKMKQEKLRDVMKQVLANTYEPPKCPDSEKWNKFQNSCYYFSSGTKTWQDSRSYCLKNEADLVVVNNQTEQDYINRAIGQTRSWIGLHDTLKEGEWIWVDNSSLTFTAWGAGEPNNAGTLRGEDCVEVIGYGTWNDGPCTAMQNFICEKPLLTLF
ncbi:CD209 antigen-like protein C [Microcaecilia unicolor]|uniref:CD209 antigen-like protein C n=1 Tax=Microcaecilia unicolor TaxID=1415580 RepID=A0A6P7WVM2_9AMPH|nr:CD209 antigen-like protein C [Microcaecilia unicolor]